MRAKADRVLAALRIPTIHSARRAQKATSSYLRLGRPVLAGTGRLLSDRWKVTRVDLKIRPAGRFYLLFYPSRVPSSAAGPNRLPPLTDC